MKDQMIRVISSPSSSTTGFLTGIFCDTGAAMLSMRQSRRWPRSSASRTGPTRSSTSRRRWATTTSSSPTPSCARRCTARGPGGPRSGSRRSVPWPAPSGRSSWGHSPTRTRRGCAPTTASATGSTRPSSTPPGTSCWGWRSSTSCTPRPGRTRGPGPTAPAPPPSAAPPPRRPQPHLAAEGEPRFLSAAYDPANRPAPEKRGTLAGMGMTEKQGGTDVRANTTIARPVDGGGPGAEYELTGHKWFMSAPMCDAFLVLAQADGGISCFLFPRWTPDGERNRFRLQRLKDKLGNRSNASSEIEFDAASAWLVGEEGAGVRTIIEMVNHTRLDCVLGGATGMRAGVAQAIHHASHRSVFGAPLVEQPLMQNVLADLCVESEAATIGAMRLARAYDEALAGDEEAGNLKRVANAVLKYWICKRAPVHAVESLECLGGNGYVEESGMPRLFRESPLNSIWEGSGNVQCLDVLRAMVKSPASVDAFFAEVLEGAGAEPRLDAYVSTRRDEIPGDVETVQTRARGIVERMALALQASLLVRYGAPASADAFCATRLTGEWGYAFGTLPAGADFSSIIEGHMPGA